MRAAGIGHVLCWMNVGGLPQERIRRSMELFAREVMPASGPSEFRHHQRHRTRPHAREAVHCHTFRAIVIRQGGFR